MEDLTLFSKQISTQIEMFMIRSLAQTHLCRLL